MTVDQLDTAGVAAHLGLSVRTIQTYRDRGSLPTEDGRLGASPWWWQSTIDAWQVARPGRGAGGGRPRKDAAHR